MKKKQKEGIGEKICSMLDISPQILPHRSLIEIHGQSLVKIQNAGKILLYTDTEIRISLRSHKSKVRVRGNGLCCGSYNVGAVGIHGKITSVDFCEGEDKNAE